MTNIALNWKNTERYSITEHGDIVDELRGKVKPVFYRNGYKCVRLNDGKKDRNEYVHRLIAMALIPNPYNLPCVNHINGDKQDNSITNLEWCSKSKNNYHAYRTGLRKSGRGGGHNTSIRCVETGAQYNSITQAAEVNEIGVTALNECLSGRNKTCARLHWEYIN